MSNKLHSFNSMQYGPTVDRAQQGSRIEQEHGKGSVKKTDERNLIIVIVCF